MHLTLGRAVDLFLAAKAAEGAAAKTLEWYGMILLRAVRGLGEDRPIEQLAGPELRAGILEAQFDAVADQRGRLRPDAQGVRQLVGGQGARPGLGPPDAPQAACPDKLVEQIGDDAMRRLLAIADVRDPGPPRLATGRRLKFTV